MPVLTPRRVKYRKMFRGQMPGVASRGSEINFGEYGMIAMSRGWVSSNQIEAARKALTHYTAKGGRVWIRIFADHPITKKPPEVRLGVGKGDVSGYVCVVRPGKMMFEMGGLPKAEAMEAIRRAGHKMSVDTRFICKE
ncbi:MAG: 50S ribosomal protein L16 [Patescibacteria group bacterium]